MLKSTLYIRLFGSLELTLGEDPLPKPPSPKARSLLAYLILRHDSTIPRDRLVGLFWPEQSDARARRALSNALWDIRRALGPAVERLVAEGDAVSVLLQPGDWLDVAEFQKNVDRRAGTAAYQERKIVELKQAVDLYRADFLEDCYDDWALVERERLREVYLRALGQLITLHKQGGDYEQALVEAQRLVAADPLREAAHRELMRLYHLLGRSRTALKQFATLCDLLTEELGVAPTPASVTLCREIAAALAEEPPPHLPIAPAPPPLLDNPARLALVGRTAERAELLAGLQAAIHGHGGAALVEGHAGVGKSRLVYEVVADARWRGLPVGLGKADPLAAPAPYRLLGDAVSPLLTPLRIVQLATLVEPAWLSAAARLFPALAEHLPDLPPLPPLDPQAEQQRLREGLGRCLAGLAAITPLLLVLEDLHWADDATTAALPHIAPHVLTSRILLILTCRAAEVRERAALLKVLDALDHAAPLLRLRLAPLTEPETQTLTRRLLGVFKTDAHIDSFTGRLHARTGGNPLLLIESLKSLAEQGILTALPDGRWTLPAEGQPLPSPVSIQALIQERLARLPPDLRDVLETLAVVGEDADAPVLSRVVDAPPDSLFGQLNDLRRHGFLVEEQAGYRFEHDLLQDTVYRAIGPQRRQSLHRRAADALAALHPEWVGALARHFDLGGARDQALHYTLEAGKRAETVCDYESALAHYRRAAQLAGREAPARWEALARQNQLLYILGRWNAATEALDEMARLAERSRDPLRRARVLYLRGRQESEAGDPHRALSLLTEALDQASGGQDAQLVGDILTETAGVYWRLGDVRRCQAAAEEALAMFRQAGDRDGERRALSALVSLHLGLTGDYAQALVCNEAIQRLAHELDNTYAAIIAQGNSSVALALLGNYKAAQQALAPALDFVERVGDLFTEGAFRIFQAINYRGLGDLAEACRCAEHALALCRQVGNPNFEIEALAVLGLAALDQGQPHDARRWLEEAVACAGRYAQEQDRAAQLAHLALAHSRLGERETALALSAQALSIIEREPEMYERLKTACFERAQIVHDAQGLQAALPHLERAYRALMSAADRISAPDLRQSFLENVAENRAIATAYRLGRLPAPLRREDVDLPAASAPTGRPLRAGELVRVTWTLSAPEDDDVPGQAERRRRRLLRLLQEAAARSAAPTVAALAAALAVSERTIKRDLAALRAAGHDVSTRGAPASTNVHITV